MMNNDSNAAPMTISGVAIGSTISRFVAAAAEELVADQGKRHERPDRGGGDGRERRQLERE